jgi:transcriptional regulator with XRE-family HTH domain
MRKRRNPVNVQVGANLRAIRKLRGLSQCESAKLMKLSRPAVVNIEFGRQNVNVATLARFAEVYRVTISDFIEPEKGE